MHRKEDNIHVAHFGTESPSGPRESVAAVLRRAREQHDQDVRSVSQILRIRQPYLEALEAGEFDKLPGTAYALGFLRTYAEYLGLNANNIVDRYKEEAQATERPTELVFPEPVVEGRIPGGAIILISVALLMVAYGGWFYLTNQGQSVADLVPALPEQIQALIDSDTNDSAPAAPETPVVEAEAPQAQAKPQTEEISPDELAAVPDPALVQVEAQLGAEVPKEAPQAEPPQQAAESSQQASVSPAPAQVVAEVEPEKPAPAVQTQAETAPDTYAGPPVDSDSAPELEALNRDEAPSPEAVAVQAFRHEVEAQDSSDTIVDQQTVVIPAPPAAPQGFSRPGERAPQIYGEGNEGARIVLRALQDSWVQVRDNQDALLLTRVLRSGDVYHVPDQTGLTLLTGNAGGIELEVDGVRLAPLGPVGAVRRQIALDPSILLTGTNQ